MSAFAAAALLTQLGLVIAMPIVLMVFFGSWVDGYLNTGGLILVPFAILGLVAGMVSAYRLIKRVTQ